MIFIELGNGKTRGFNNIIDFLEATEDGLQNIIAENKGSYVDPAKSNRLDLDEDINIEGLPELPSEEYSENND